MTPGVKTNIIRKLATALSGMDNTDGDLVLRQFGLPWAESWNSNGYSYYLSMLEQGEDSKLFELHEYFFPNDTLPIAQVTSRAGNWKEGRLKAFLSHSSKNKLVVAQIKTLLSDYGIDCFVAHEDIEGSTQWLDEIKVALNTCDVLIAFLCDDFQKSQYCDQEIGFAVQRGIPIIPVKITVNPYGFIGPIQALTMGKQDPEHVAKQLKNLIAKSSTLSPRVQHAEKIILEELVEQFLASPTYTYSTKTLEHFENLKRFPRDLAERIRDNWQKNDQITGCYGIPDRMKKFLSLHIPPQSKN